MLQNCSMLAELIIHRWTATKHDKAVSKEVERAHDAHNAGRYNKALIDKSHLAEIDVLGGQLRTFHYRLTLPWTDKGARLLPTKLFDQYREGFGQLRDKRDAAVNAFLDVYPSLVSDARQRLKTMFCPTDYPSVDELRSAFSVELELMPVPNANDMRLNVLDEQLQQSLRTDILRTLATRQEQATKDCWARVKEVVGRVAEQCAKPKPRIYDSLTENVEELANLIDGLNVADDKDVANVGQALRELIISPEQLRNSHALRCFAVERAEAILRRVPT